MNPPNKIPALVKDLFEELKTKGFMVTELKIVGTKSGIPYSYTNMDSEPQIIKPSALIKREGSIPAFLDFCKIHNIFMGEHEEGGWETIWVRYLDGNLFNFAGFSFEKATSLILDFKLWDKNNRDSSKPFADYKGGIDTLREDQLREAIAPMVFKDKNGTVDYRVLLQALKHNYPQFYNEDFNLIELANTMSRIGYGAGLNPRGNVTDTIVGIRLNRDFLPPKSKVGQVGGQQISREFEKFILAFDCDFQCIKNHWIVTSTILNSIKKQHPKLFKDWTEKDVNEALDGMQNMGFNVGSRKEAGKVMGIHHRIHPLKYPEGRELPSNEISAKFAEHFTSIINRSKGLDIGNISAYQLLQQLRRDYPEHYFIWSPNLIKHLLKIFWELN